MRLSELVGSIFKDLDLRCLFEFEELDPRHLPVIFNDGVYGI